MKLPYSEPDPAGSERARKARAQRNLATEISRLTPQALTRANGEEADFGPTYPSSFTKGLQHNEWGLLKSESDYLCFVEGINSPDPTVFEKWDIAADPRLFKCTGEGAKAFKWRGWESPRSGHVYELQGPDAGAVGMAPAPRIHSSELAAEMAEVYAMAILRDVPFSVIEAGGSAQSCSGGGKSVSVLTAKQVAVSLSSMSYFTGKSLISSTPYAAPSNDCHQLNQFERNRRKVRSFSDCGQPQGNGKITVKPENLFRGSTQGSHRGPYISQFMLIGNGSLPPNPKRPPPPEGPGRPKPPVDPCNLEPPQYLTDGKIRYGSLNICQQTRSQKCRLDYMTTWCSWLDVQNGANLKNTDVFDTPRFITTPRDLATYVHFDALYEAYLNACLIMLGMGVPHSKGFPEPSVSGQRDAFATFGGPHILSLVCEVATRCLKAVRRQKFNYHRRARPETIGGRLALTELGEGQRLECAEEAFCYVLGELPDQLKKAIIKHNHLQNDNDACRPVECGDANCFRPLDEEDLPPEEQLKPEEIKHRNKLNAQFADANLLLPMAFPEGSPMHPAYGAGHATVAGGCVTMLKAFFEMFEDCHSFEERKLTVDSNGRYQKDGTPVVYEPTTSGAALRSPTNCDPLTIQGELDKLAANISIGRNMAGVHYYSDYYDSLRMGERIAVGILMEQAPTYGEAVEWSFKSFDDDLIVISGEGGSCPSLSVMDRDGNPVTPEGWWLRHVSGREFSEDL